MYIQHNGSAFNSGTIRNILSHNILIQLLQTDLHTIP